MTLAPGTYAIGPDTGQLLLRTKREGMASKVGHDLLITLPQWSGHIVLADAEPASAKIDAELDLSSFEILEGTGGVATLSADDKKDITATALKLLDVEQHPHATFVSTAVKANGSGGTIEGTLELRGTSAPITVEVTETGEQAWRGTATIVQTAFGIKPYRAFFGALRLADPVELEVAVDLSSATPQG